MVETNLPEFPNLVSLVAERCQNTWIGHFLHTFEHAIFSMLVVALIVIIMYIGSRNMRLVPHSMQNVIEYIVESLDDFICGMLGKRGRKLVPFLGTLFIYILCMNLLGLIPFMKSATASWSTTLVLGLCVFVYVQYIAFKEFGIKGYADHLMGSPRGAIAFSVVMPIMMFVLHSISELIKPISLSLRLRSNIWGEDMMLAMFAGFGLKSLPLLFVNMLMAILSAVVQAAVFFILATVYFKLVMHEEEPEVLVENNTKINVTMQE